MNYDLLGQFLYNIILVEIIPNNPLHDLDHFPAHKNPGGNQLIAKSWNGRLAKPFSKKRRGETSQNKKVVILAWTACFRYK
jgi:hypothetical protein